MTHTPSTLPATFPLTNYDAAVKSLAIVVSIDEAKLWADKAAALREYARQQHDPQMEASMAAIRIRAMRRIGEISAALETVQGQRPQLVPTAGDKSKTETLKAAGISKGAAYRSEKLAEIPEATFDDYINNAVASGHAVTGDDVMRKVGSQTKKQTRRDDLNRQAEDIRTGKIATPDGLFDVIVIDPPWEYGTQLDPLSRRVASPYPEMSQDQLLSIELPAKADSVLWLWTTHKFLFDAKELMDKWGFEYKATLVWDKEKMGMGAWLRMECEFCFLGIRGNPAWDNTTHRDIIRAPRREHSRKPDEFYSAVETMTAGRRLEYFSREPREGWEGLGNAVDTF